MSTKKPSVSQTKLKLSVVAMGLAFVGFILINYLPSLEGTYSTLISALLGIVALYSGSNVGQEWLARTRPTPPPSEPPKE